MTTTLAMRKRGLKTKSNETMPAKLVISMAQGNAGTVIAHEKGC